MSAEGDNVFASEANLSTSPGAGMALHSCPALKQGHGAQVHESLKGRGHYHRQRGFPQLLGI